MYAVSLFNAGEEVVINYPSSDKEAPHLFKMDLSEKAGQASQFKFTIYSNNPGYDKIFDLITTIKIIKDDQEAILEGRVFQSELEMDANGIFYKDVVVESELAYINDTRTRLWTITNMSVRDFMTKVIDNHNLHTTADKIFNLGNIDVIGNITCTTAYENSLNILLDKMVNVLGVGYLVVRKEGNSRYLDYLITLSGTSAPINLGENMKDMLFNKDVTNIGTRIIPIGADNLSIAAVNSGLDYLDNVSAIAEFGIIEQTMDFKDITTAAELKTAGQSKLLDAGKAIYKLTSNVLDLSTIKLSPHSFYVGTDTTISNPVINFNETFNIIQKDTDLLNPQNCKITLNSKFETMTDKQIALQRVSQYVEKILTADKQLNTFYLSGYIDLLKNQMGAMADTAEKQQTKAILFEDKQIGSPSFGAMALGTQGFMIASKIVNGDWDWSTFGTGKGFTADLIVAGTIIGDMIKGGTIVGCNIQQTMNGKIVNEFASNENGGVVNVFDRNGKPNVYIGSEYGSGNNVGGTMVLYNDSLATKGLELFINRDRNAGEVVVRKDGLVRGYLTAYSQNGESGLFLYDNTYTLRSWFTDKQAVVANKMLATQEWVNARVATSETWVNGRIYDSKTSFQSWAGTIAKGNSIAITHNCGYVPRINISSNANGTYIMSHTDTESVCTVFNSGSSAGDWTGIIRIY